MIKFWDPSSLPYVIEWGAWATIVAGIAAVVGAVAVGLKQAEIASKQAGIADRQAQIMERQTLIAERVADTEASRLRYELYEKRVEVYAGIEQYLQAALNYEALMTVEVHDGMYKSMAVARFVLGDDVDVIAKDILAAGVSLKIAFGQLEALRDDQKQRRTQLSERIEGLSEHITARHADLRRTMEGYLRLTQPPATAN